MKKPIPQLILAASVATALSTGVTNAATFITGFQGTLATEGAVGAIGEGGPYHVSVNPNNPGYAGLAPNPGTPFQRSFTKPVLGYSFVGGGTNGVLTIAQQSGGLITYTTTSTTWDSFGQNQRRLWTTNDPGANLLTATSPNFTGPGYRGGFVNATANIDISGLGSGTAYVFYGDFRGTPSLTAVMRDTDGNAPDITIANAHLNGDFANRGEYYVAELDFETDGIYDEIEYVWTANGDGGTNGRFGGTVLTGEAFVATVIPEPSSLALLGLGGIAILLRRRK